MSEPQVMGILNVTPDSFSDGGKFLNPQAALEQEIEFLGPTRVKDVEDAQAKVVAEVRRLEEAGEIVISGGEDDVLV